jgi:hypothetical protein
VAYGATAILLAKRSELTNSFLVVCLSYLSIGKQTNVSDVVIGLEEKVTVTPRRPHRFGTAGASTNLFSEAWKEEEHIFAAEGIGRRFNTSTTKELGHPGRVTPDVLNQHPVEVLAIEENEMNTGFKERCWIGVQKTTDLRLSFW